MLCSAVGIPRPASFVKVHSWHSSLLLHRSFIQHHFLCKLCVTRSSNGINSTPTPLTTRSPCATLSNKRWLARNSTWQMGNTGETAEMEDRQQFLRRFPSSSANSPRLYASLDLIAELVTIPIGEGGESATDLAWPLSHGTQMRSRAITLLLVTGLVWRDVIRPPHQLLNQSPVQP